MNKASTDLQYQNGPPLDDPVADAPEVDWISDRFDPPAKIEREPTPALCGRFFVWFRAYGWR